MVPQELANPFTELLDRGQYAEVVDFLASALRRDDLSDETRCWALWNISDRFACQPFRDPEREYVNHRRFERQLSVMDTSYLPWIVSDGSQRCTLMLGGYGSYWFDLYKHSCTNIRLTSENQRIYFESHRAAIVVPGPILDRFNETQATFALKQMEELLPRLSDDHNYRFCDLAYYDCLIWYHQTLGNPIQPLLEDAAEAINSAISLLDSSETSEGLFVLGSWERLNAKRAKQLQAKVAIHNFIIRLVDSAMYRAALELNSQVKQYHLEYGRYFKSKLAIALQNEGQRDS